MVKVDPSHLFPFFVTVLLARDRTIDYLTHGSSLDTVLEAFQIAHPEATVLMVRPAPGTQPVPETNDPQPDST